MKALMLVVVVVGMLGGKSWASFNDCYSKCFIFCMIEPSQTLCSCTTHCLKDCIFQQIQSDDDDDDDDDRSNNLGFCKLGCALSSCSTFSSKRTPNGNKVGSCVGSCSNKCTITYSSTP